MITLPTRYDGVIFRTYFWRRSQYETYHSALNSAAIYGSDSIQGFDEFMQAMAWTKKAAECVDGSSIKDDLMVCLYIDGSLWHEAMPIEMF